MPHQTDHHSKGQVVIVDDELHIRLSARQTLELDDYDVSCYGSAEDALNTLQPGWPGVVVSDIKMPKMDGMTFMKNMRLLDPDIPVILITGHGDVALAVEALREGAYDFIEKPFPADILVDVVNRATEKRRLEQENKALRRQLDERKATLARLLGNAPVINRLRQLISNIASSDVDVLITGETGTGKELVARCLHSHGPRNSANFVAVNCGAMPEAIFESELFGHEAGAFVGAHERRIGKIEYASSGTLFLDEIETMPLNLQVKLLRVLQERTIERLGSNREIPVDLRVIAASKTDLQKAVTDGLFREDLFYRLNVVSILTPPLRSWHEDVMLLFGHFTKSASERFNRPVPELSDNQHKLLISHAWPGNVRELKNTAERFVLTGGLNLIENFSVGEEPTIDPNLSLPEQVETFEKNVIKRALQQTQGSIKDALDLLGVPRKTLSDKMRKYGLDRSDFVPNQSCTTAFQDDDLD